VELDFDIRPYCGRLSVRTDGRFETPSFDRGDRIFVEAQPKTFYYRNA
jgi:hypothetical protein